MASTLGRCVQLVTTARCLRHLTWLLPKDMDIAEGSDPYVIGELLKEYFRDLKQPLCTYKRYEEFDEINGAQPLPVLPSLLPTSSTLFCADLPSVKQLRQLRVCIDELPKVRRYVVLSHAALLI